MGTFVGSFRDIDSAALQGHGKIATMLLELDADIDAEFGSDGSTALTLADTHGHHDIVAMLEAARARTRAVTKRREKRKLRRRRRGKATTNVDESPHYVDPSPKPPQPQVGSEETTCVVCMDEDREVSHMCYPCGHLCVCAICARHFDAGRCPTCRAEVVHTMAVYRV